MCEIYREFCRLCGDPTSFHLGDFNTDRFEIAYICSRCFKSPEKDEWKQNVQRWLEHLKFNYAIWSSPAGNYAVVALTENAWVHHYQNHLNVSETEFLEAIIHTPLRSEDSDDYRGFPEN